MPIIVNILEVFVILQVYYNVTVRYQTTAGERVFNDSDTIDLLPDNQNHLGIPLYNANSTYTVRITAITDNISIISPDYIITEDEFEGYRVGNSEFCHASV